MSADKSQYTPPPSAVPTPSAKPFLHLVACGSPDPADVIVPESVADILLAKGWIPPGTVITITPPRPLLQPWLLQK